MYITDLKAISPQESYTEEVLSGQFKVHTDMVYRAIEPNYIGFIPKGLLRRMGKAVRMGVGSGLPLINDHQDIEGILVATANGGMEDCIKFLNQIVDYDEGILTPTNFVQSTPNAIAGQIALLGQNRGYNITYTNGGLAFENALQDAMLLFEEGSCNKLLVGGVEEISDYSYNIDFLLGKYKTEPIDKEWCLDSNTAGAFCGEGASFFVLASGPKGSLCRIKDLDQITYPKESDIEQLVSNLLSRNGLTPAEIDSVVLGYNGDVRHNNWYDHVGNSVFGDANVFCFKHLVGEYRVCSSAALWLLTHLFQGNRHLYTKMIKENRHDKPLKNTLIYNHFDADQHSFILVQRN